MTPSFRITLKVVAFALGLNLVSAGRGAAQHGEEKHNMRLLGFNNLQARSAYQPVIQSQGRRWIAYVGHHGGQALNPRSPPSGAATPPTPPGSSIASSNAALPSDRRCRAIAGSSW